MLAAALLYNEKVELTVGTIILCNFILITMMTDRSVQNQPIPLWMDVTNWTCLAVYTLEMVVFLYVERMRTFLHFRQCFDVVVVVASVTGEILEAVKVGVGTGTFSLLRVFRLMRLLRIVRAARALGQIKELMKLVQMMASCFKTLFWAFCMTFLVMTMWSHLAVLFIQPLIEELDQKHVWDDCGSRCQKAFVSVMRANLTFFQTVVASDSWGEVAVPVIEEYPFTALIFVGALLTLVFGMLNLIVAVVVDAFADGREKDLKSRARERMEKELQEKEVLHKIFRKMDCAKSGEMTFVELSHGAHTVPEFKQRLRLMNIGLDDLQQLFSLLDEDGSGTIEPAEFAEVFYRLKTTDSTVATVFQKHYIMEIKKKQVRMMTMLHDMNCKLAHLENSAGHRTSSSQKPLHHASSNSDTGILISAEDVVHTGAQVEQSGVDWKGRIRSNTPDEIIQDTFALSPASSDVELRLPTLLTSTVWQASQPCVSVGDGS